MKHRFYGFLAAVAIVAFGCPRTAKSEVYAELDSSGAFVDVRQATAQAGHAERVWEPSGAADSLSLVLNPNGDLRGDGRPDVAIDPASGLPVVVWAGRRAGGFDIVASSFNGSTWSPISVVSPSNRQDDLDPRLGFTPDGIAIVTWWVQGSVPTVRMAYRVPGHGWTDAGIVSEPDERAKKPALLQQGNLTIIAYRTPRGIRIATRTLTSPVFGDGPTPFPRNGGGPQDSGPGDGASSDPPALPMPH